MAESQCAARGALGSPHLGETGGNRCRPRPLLRLGLLQLRLAHLVDVRHGCGRGGGVRHESKARRGDEAGAWEEALLGLGHV